MIVVDVVFLQSFHGAWWGIVDESDGLFVLAVGLPDWCVCESGVGSPWRYFPLLVGTIQ